MKNIKWISVCFALLAVLLILGSVALSFAARQLPVSLIALSDSAEACTLQFSERLNGGDLEGALALVAGNWDTSRPDEEASVLSDALWEWYSDSITLSYSGECYASESGIARDAVIEAMSIPDVLAVLQERSDSLLSERIKEIGAEAACNEDGSYCQDFVMETLRDGIAGILAEGACTFTREITLQLVNEDGQWMILPDQALVEILSGGMGR